MTLEKPIKWDISWLPKPQRGGRYSSSEWSGIRQFFRSIQYVENDVSEDFSVLHDFAKKADKIIWAGFNLNKGYDFLPSDFVKSSVESFETELRQEYYPIWKTLPFNLVSDAKSRTYENVLDYFLVKTEIIWRTCSKYIENTTDARLVNAANGQEFLDIILKKQKNEFCFGDFARGVILERKFNEKRLLFSVERVTDEPIVRNLMSFYNGKLINNSDEDFYKYALQGKMSLQEYHRIAAKAQQREADERAEIARKCREELTAIFDAMYDAFVVRNQKLTLGNMTRAVSNTHFVRTSMSDYLTGSQRQTTAIEFRLKTGILFRFSYYLEDGAYFLVSLAHALKCITESGDAYETIMFKCNKEKPNRTDTDFQTAMRETYRLLKNPTPSVKTALQNELSKLKMENQ